MCLSFDNHVHDLTLNPTNAFHPILHFANARLRIRHAPRAFSAATQQETSSFTPPLLRDLFSFRPVNQCCVGMLHTAPPSQRLHRAMIQLGLERTNQPCKTQVTPQVVAAWSHHLHDPPADLHLGSLPEWHLAAVGCDNRCRVSGYSNSVQFC